MNPTAKVDTREFQQTLERYKRVSRRTNPEIVNTKSYFIARRAVVETIKADKGKISAFFGRRTQKVVGMIINKRRGEKGQKGLYGDAMAEAQALMKAARLRSVSFIKSGWIWVIKELEPYTTTRRNAARKESSVVTRDRPKGGATPAREAAFHVKAIIENSAQSKHSTTPEAIIKFGLPALQKSIDFERASMVKYMEDKYREAAEKSGIKTH